MARESQGLQIALIVFVMLTIIFGVTTFLVSREYKKATALAESAQADKQSAEEGQRAALDENIRLKQIIGQPDTATRDVIDQQFNNDMQTYGKDFGNLSPDYHSLSEALYRELQNKESALQAEKKRSADMQARNQRLEADKEKQIQQHVASVKKATQDLQQERQKYNNDRSRLTKQNQDLQAQLAQARQKADASVAKATGELTVKERELKTAQERNKDLQVKIETIDPPVIEHPDGKIRWINQRQRTVWIDLGRADGLSRLTSFSVYDADAHDLTDSGHKGAIEVTDIIDDHMAEARIVEDVIQNPMAIGDLIFTPLWQPGQRQHFAFTEGIDLDDDKKSDIDYVRNLVSMNGGVVDYWVTDDGQKHGQMNAGTRYLVMGSEPDTTQTQRIAARTETLRNAGQLGLRQMTLAELLNRMGYKRETSVVPYGRNINPADWRAKPPEGVPRTSSGNVSDLFRKRVPPPTSGNSAY